MGFMLENKFKFGNAAIVKRFKIIGYEYTSQIIDVMVRRIKMCGYGKVFAGTD